MDIRWRKTRTQGDECKVTVNTCNKTDSCVLIQTKTRHVSIYDFTFFFMTLIMCCKRRTMLSDMSLLHRTDLHGCRPKRRAILYGVPRHRSAICCPWCQIVAREARVCAAVEPPTAVQVFGTRVRVSVSVYYGM